MIELLSSREEMELFLASPGWQPEELAASWWVVQHPIIVNGWCVVWVGG